MSAKNNGADEAKTAPKEPVEPVACGLIMPISAIDGLPSEHWTEVKAILTDAIDGIPAPRFAAKLVSEADEVGVIQKRIIQSIYNSPIAVCDVSAKNPNVMFELGMRLAFDKPTVIVKDEKTDYSFDTGVIEHVTYPRDLRFTKIVDFKNKLADKVLSTYNAGRKDPTHSPFLRSFGEFHVAALPQTVVPTEKFILETLGEIQRELQLLRRRNTEEKSAAPPIDLGEVIREVVRRHSMNQSIPIPKLLAMPEFLLIMQAELAQRGIFMDSAALGANLRATFAKHKGTSNET